MSVTHHVSELNARLTTCGAKASRVKDKTLDPARVTCRDCRRVICNHLDTPPKTTLNPARERSWSPPVHSDRDVAREDAQRYLDDLTFQRVPTDDPADIIRELLGSAATYTQEEHDAALDELEKEHESAIEDIERDRDETQRERDLYEGRMEDAEGKTEQLEVDLKDARDALALVQADARYWRDAHDRLDAARLDQVRLQEEVFMAGAFCVAVQALVPRRSYMFAGRLVHEYNIT